MSKRWHTLIIIILGILIVCAVSYPFVSDYLLGEKQSQYISQFNKSDKHLSNKDWLSAFYKKSTSKKDHFDDSLKSNTGSVARSKLNTIAVLYIPKLKETLPVFDNTSELALDNGVGLLENTSDLLGGKGKHSVITGHAGLSIGKLFTNLSKLTYGDKFYVKINGEIHAYQVDQIKKVTPDNLSYFKIDKNKDYVTLVTCTPLFINTHRLLVRGHRIKTDVDNFGNEKSGLTKLGLISIIVVLSLIVVITLGLILYLRNRKFHY